MALLAEGFVPYAREQDPRLGGILPRSVVHPPLDDP
jgi:hypothetical protein